MLRTAFLLVLGLAAGLPVGCADPRTEVPPGVLTVSKEQQASWVRNFNPLTAADLSRWPTTGGIYETLLVFNTVTGQWTPWLATAWSWADDKQTVTFTLREGVRWSDGQPFTARDVAFTFELLQRHPALDLDNTREFLERVDTPDDHTVVFRLKRPYVPGLSYLAHQCIVPEHVWKDVDDPVTFANEDPVATGPFTEVRTFRDQLYVLGRNPDYWQPGKPAVDALRFPALSSNDQANLGLIHGEVDWAGNFVPAIDRIFVARDPEHHRYWFPLVGNTVMLYPNTQHAPLDDVRVRKALSLAIDREQLVRVAMYGYTRPADATGLSDVHEDLRDPKAVAAGDWVAHDRHAAAALLDEAGYAPDSDGVRLHLRLDVVNGWSDWVRAAQIVARQLAAIGIEVDVETWDFSAWFDRLQRGEFELSIAWSIQGPSPYVFYRNLLSAQQVQPIGTPAATNWHRFASERADELLRALERTDDAHEIERLTHALEHEFVASAPVIPLFLGPSWGAFNTTRFDGFPDADHPYAKLSPNDRPETLLVLTELRPR